MLRDAKVIAVTPDHHSVDIEYRATSEIIRDVKIAGRVYWNLQPGDFVLVGFIDSIDNPVVLDKVLLRGDPRIKESKKDDIHLIHEVGPVDEDGKITEITGRIEVHTDVEGNLTLALSGIVGTLNLKALGDEGNINIEGVGQLNVTAPSGVNVTTKGDAIVTAVGNIEATATGDIKATAGGGLEAIAKGDVKVDGASVELGKNLVKQLVNNFPVCLFTGAKHAIGNINVEV